MSRRTVIAVLVALLGGGAAAAVKLRPRPVTASRVVRGSAVDAVYASGTVECVDRVEVKARVAGPVADLEAHEGDAVTRGQLLARIDAPTLAFDVERGLADLQAARERSASSPQVAALEAQGAALSAQLAQARADLARVTALARSGAASPQELDRARTQVASLEAQLAANEAQRRDVRISLRADSARQRAGVASLRSRANDAEVRSPLDGVVLARHVEPGEVVGVNQNLLRVGDLRRLQIEARIDEGDVGRVRAGSPAVVRFQAFEAQVFTGRVTRILPDADRVARSFEVRVELDTAVEGLRPGMTAEVNVVLARHDAVLIAPADGVVDGVAWVAGGEGRAHRRTVQTGIRDLARVEVTGGLRDGDAVITGDTSALSEGARVRATVQPLPAGEASGGAPTAPRAGM